MPEKPSVTLTGKVKKIIQSPYPAKADIVEIRVESSEPLYRDLRIENSLTSEGGDKVGLKPGSAVQVTVTADTGSTTLQPLPEKP